MDSRSLGRYVLFALLCERAANTGVLLLRYFEAKGGGHGA